MLSSGLIQAPKCQVRHPREESSVEIPEKTIGQVCVVSVTGRLDAYASGEVERKLDSLITANHGQLVVDFSKLEYISSSGLRVLLAALKKVRKVPNGDLRLSGLQPYVKEVFDISGFTQLFKLFAGEDEAVKSYQTA
jgi:anti-sigma B factor antagonist